MAKVDSRRERERVEVSWTEGESEVEKRKKGRRGGKERIEKRSKPRREEEKERRFVVENCEKENGERSAKSQKLWRIHGWSRERRLRKGKKDGEKS